MRYSIYTLSTVLLLSACVNNAEKMQTTDQAHTTTKVNDHGDIKKVSAQEVPGKGLGLGIRFLNGGTDFWTEGWNSALGVGSLHSNRVSGLGFTVLDWDSGSWIDILGSWIEIWGLDLTR